jgi:catechol 2,3-dioxygenase-like lactoylglutathione lyase family enzyme
MPNLENLKKQAKQYLRWHHDGYYPVAAQIRSLLRRYSHMSDSEILAHRFRLSDAQELVARKAGFASWQALTQGISTMTISVTKTDRTSTLLATEAQLFVGDIKTACDFYVQKLGFQIGFIYGEPPFYAQVFRDGARLNLRHVDGPVFDAQFRARTQDALSATITVDDIKSLFLAFQAVGATFHQTLRSEPWGARTFIIQDPDGNLVMFAGGTG